MQTRLGTTLVELAKGDITAQAVDAIVNPAGRRLTAGGGVDRAIHAAGGPEIAAEAMRRYPDGCPPGEAVITGAGRLQARFVIHAVGPVWQSDQRDWCADTLGSAYRRSLQLAAGQGCRSVAFPSIGTGEFGYPLGEAARTAVAAVRESLAAGSPLRLVRWVLNDDVTCDAYGDALRLLTNAEDGNACANPLCRNRLPAEARFCPRCGRRLTAVPVRR